jgi:hypothetical protein
MSIKEMEEIYNVRINAIQDDLPVRGNCIATEDKEFDKTVEDEILERLDNGDVWAWADVEVQATLPDGRTGSAYLGGCCYEDEADFCEHGGYYEGMILSAVEDAKAKPLPKIPCEEEPFLQDLLSFVAYVHRNTDMDDSKKLSLLVTTLMHDLSGIIDGDTHFLPRVNGYRSKYPLI